MVKLHQLNVIQNMKKNYCTKSAAATTALQAKDECQAWSKLTLAASDLATELIQAVKEKTPHPVAQDLDLLKETSEKYTKASTKLLSLKRRAGYVAGFEKSELSLRRALYVSSIIGASTIGGIAIALGYAAGVYGLLCGPAVASLALHAGTKLAKHNRINQTKSVTEEIAETFKNDDLKPDHIKENIKKIKEILDNIPLDENNAFDADKANTLNNKYKEIVSLMNEVENKRTNPLIQKISEREIEREKNLANPRNLNDLNDALKTLKGLEIYKPIRERFSVKDNIIDRTSDIEHFFAKLDKREIKKEIRQSN